MGAPTVNNNLNFYSVEDKTKKKVKSESEENSSESSESSDSDEDKEERLLVRRRKVVREKNKEKEDDRTAPKRREASEQFIRTKSTSDSTAELKKSDKIEKPLRMKKPSSKRIGLSEPYV